MRDVKGDGGPVKIGVAIGDGAEEAVTDHAGEWHGDGEILGGLQHEVDIFEAEGQFESGGRKFFLDDAGRVVVVDGSAEESSAEHFEEDVRIDLGLSGDGEDLAETLKNTGDHEISA